MMDGHYGIGPCIIAYLPVLRAENERTRLRNLEHEQRYRAEIERLNRTTDREIWR